MRRRANDPANFTEWRCVARCTPKWRWLALLPALIPRQLTRVAEDKIEKARRMMEKVREEEFARLSARLKAEQMLEEKRTSGHTGKGVRSSHAPGGTLMFLREGSGELALMPVACCNEGGGQGGR